MCPTKISCKTLHLPPRAHKHRSTMTAAIMFWSHVMVDDITKKCLHMTFAQMAKSHCSSQNRAHTQFQKSQKKDLKRNFNISHRGHYQHWTRDPRTRDLKTWGPGTGGPRVLRTVLHLAEDRNAIAGNLYRCSKIELMAVSLYSRCTVVVQSTVTHKRFFLHQIVLFHNIH